MRGILRLSLLTILFFPSLVFANDGNSKYCSLLASNNVVTQTGPVRAITLPQSKSKNVLLKIGEEMMVLTLENGAPQLVPINLKENHGIRLFYNSWRLGEYERSVLVRNGQQVESSIRREGNVTYLPTRSTTPAVKAEYTGNVFYIVHPKQGLIAVSDTGILLRLTPEVSALKAQDIKQVVTSTTTGLLRDSIQIILQDGTTYSLFHSTSRWDDWPVLAGNTYLVEKVRSNPASLDSYQFLELSRFSLRRLSYVTDGRNYWNINSEELADFTQAFEYDTKVVENILLKVTEDNSDRYIFATSEGLAVYNPTTGKLKEKLAPQKWNVENLIHLPESGELAVIDDGHLRLIELDDILEPFGESFGFTNGDVPRRRRSESEGLFSSIGTILKIKVLGYSSGVTTVEIHSVKPQPGRNGQLEHVSGINQVETGRDYEIEGHILTIQPDGTATLRSIGTVRQIDVPNRGRN